MKKLATILTFVMGITFVACKPSDEKIQDEVNTKLSSTCPGVSGKVTKGVVVLTGLVVDETVKEDATNAVQDIQGVKSVDNRVTIDLLPPPPPSSDSVAISPDETLRKSLDSGFAANGIQGVKATVGNGEVTLTGSVPKTSLRKILQVAHEAHPKKVNNQLTLK